MKSRTPIRLLAVGLAAAITLPAIAEQYDVVFGKNKDWLFTGYEYG